MANSICGDIITNELFLKVYDSLKINEFNQSKHSKTVQWDQMENVFSELEIDLQTKPTEKVSNYQKKTDIKSIKGCNR